MYCNKCGNEIAADAKFCPKCGAQYHAKGSVAKKGKMGNKKRITIIAIGCVCLIALISVLGYLGKKYYDRYRAFRSGNGVYIGEGWYRYNSDDGEAILTRWRGGMEIPSQITLGLHTYRVTKIGRAFYSCDSLTSITLPSSVTEIGYEAFSYCHNLISIMIPDGVEVICSEAFYGSKLTSISLPNSEVKIGEEAIPSQCMISYRNPSSSDDYDGSDSGYKREDFVSDKAYREYLEYDLTVLTTTDREWGAYYSNGNIVTYESQGIGSGSWPDYNGMYLHDGLWVFQIEICYDYRDGLARLYLRPANNSYGCEVTGCDCIWYSIN